MKASNYRYLRLLTIAVCMGLMAGRTHAGEFIEGAPNGIPGRWLVLLEDTNDAGAERSPAARQTVASRASELLAVFPGKKPERTLENVRAFVVHLNRGAARRLANSPGVALVEQDRLIEAQAPTCPAVLYPPASTQPTSPQQVSCPVFYSDNNCNDNWGLDRIDQHSAPLNGLFYFTGTGAGAHIYLLDTGIDYNHPEFKNTSGTSRVGTSINFAGNGYSQTDPWATVVNPSSFYDTHGHGTHVAGIAAGLRRGVAKASTLHAVRVFNSAAISTTSLVAQGINWIIQNHVDPAVVNFSANFNAGAQLQSDPSALNVMETMFRDMVTVHGITVVNSAGNFNKDAYDYSPSRVSELIVVGASDYNNERWREADAFEPCYIRNPNPETEGAYSQCGSNFGTYVDIWAPGAFITSAWPGSGICRQTGTSMAAPHVTGSAAVYLATNPAATPAQVLQALISNASNGVLNSSTLGSAGTPNRLLRSFP